MANAANRLAFHDGPSERCSAGGYSVQVFITNPSSLRMSYAMMRNRFGRGTSSRCPLVRPPETSQFAERIAKFLLQRYLRPKAASEMRTC